MKVRGRLTAVAVLSALAVGGAAFVMNANAEKPAAKSLVDAFVTNTPQNPVPVAPTGPVAVNVGGTVAVKPVPQSDVVQVREQLSFPASAQPLFDRVTLYTVPQGKRFVGEYASVSGQGGPNGFTTASIATGDISPELAGEHFRVSDDSQGFSASGPLTFYAGPGTTIEGLAQRGAISRDVVFEFDLVGHLEDLPG
jgi:hypothetical protein